MASFEHSLAALAAVSGARTPVALGVATLLLVAWILWAAAGAVTLYEVSTAARIEITSATAPLESPLLGKVVFSALALGRRVEAGALLVELDSRAEQLAKREVEAELDGIAPRIQQLEVQLAAEREARTLEESGAQFQIDEARSTLAQAETAAAAAARELDRLRRLRADGLVAGRDLDIAEVAASRFASAHAAAGALARRIADELAAGIHDRNSAIASLFAEIAAATAARDALRARAASLDYEIERRRIRAPAAGRIAEALDLRVGAVLDEAQKIGSIAPDDGALHVVAQFPAAAALGRLRAGQPAKIRLDAFPWAEYGTVDARVTTVAQEVRDDAVRVDFELLASPRFRGLLAHGVPGVAEVQVETVSPFRLVARTVGEWAAAPL